MCEWSGELWGWGFMVKSLTHDSRRGNVDAAKPLAGVLDCAALWMQARLGRRPASAASSTRWAACRPRLSTAAFLGLPTPSTCLGGLASAGLLHAGSEGGNARSGRHQQGAAQLEPGACASAAPPVCLVHDPPRLQQSARVLGCRAWTGLARSCWRRATPLRLAPRAGRCPWQCCSMARAHPPCPPRPPRCPTPRLRRPRAPSTPNAAAAQRMCLASGPTAPGMESSVARFVPSTEGAGGCPCARAAARQRAAAAASTAASPAQTQAAARTTMRRPAARRGRA